MSAECETKTRATCFFKNAEKYMTMNSFCRSGSRELQDCESAIILAYDWIFECGANSDFQILDSRDVYS